MGELPPIDNDGDSLVVNQLIAEYMSRTDSGEALTPERFIQEHSEHTEELQRHFENVALLEHFNDSPSTDQTIITPDKSQESSLAQTRVRGNTDSETSITRKQSSRDFTVSDLTIPKNFGRYAIQQVLGQGAMGAVYLARDTQLDRNVALKIPKFVDMSKLEEEEMLARFYREARASATLRSPNICPVYDVGEIDGQHYITMAYIEGRPLKDFTKSKKKHSEKQIAATIRKLAQGLAQAHDIGVIHRDLKPANIMIDQHGEPVVMDFGLARRSSSDDVQVTQSGAILGTPAYMSPEQVEGDQENIGPQADIYALGVIMYELITGEMPFKGNLMSTLQQIAINNPTKPTELRTDLDPRMETICLKMMAGEMEKRYRSMHDVASDLQAVLRNPSRKQKKEQAQNTGPKPTSIPTAKEDSHPALVSIDQPKPSTEQLREKKSQPGNRHLKNQKTKTPSENVSSNRNKKLLVAGGLGGLLLILSIIMTLKDSSGNTLKDSSGKNQNEKTSSAKQVNLPKKPAESPTSSDSLNQHSLLFDGTNAYVSVDSVHVEPGEPFCVEYWVKCDDDIPEGSSGTITSVGPYNNMSYRTYQNSSVFYSNFNILKIEQDSEKRLMAEFSRLKIQPNTWIHIATQTDSSGQCVTYVNGKKDSHEKESSKNLNLSELIEQTKSSWPSKKNLTIGATYHQGGFTLAGNKHPIQFFKGEIREFRMSSDVRYVGNFVPETRFDNDSNTMVLYHFDQPDTDTLKDTSGNGHDGKIIGAKWVQTTDSPNSRRESSSMRVNDISGPLPKTAEVLTSDAYEWTEPVNLGATINSPEQEETFCLSGDGLTLIVSKDDPTLHATNDLYISHRESFQAPWSKLVRMSNNINLENNGSHYPSLSPDECTLLFVSRRYGGLGGDDIWMSSRQDKESKWGKAIWMGNHINSEFNERSPQLYPDGNKLLFARETNDDAMIMLTTRESVSDEWGEPSKLSTQSDFLMHPYLSYDQSCLLASRYSPRTSSKDLFASSQDKETKEWEPIEHLGLKINSEHRENCPIFSPLESVLYFSSDRPGGEGKHDIWMSRRIKKSSDVSANN